MRTYNFNAHTMEVFSEMNTNYEAMSNLMTDVALKHEIYDAETDKVISSAEANAKILEFSRKVLGIKDINDHKAVRRAIRDNARQFYDIIEDTVEQVITVGFKEDEWFTDLVDYRNIAYGDRQDFYIEKESVLSVAKAGVSHHDHIIQRISAGETVSIPTSLHAIKVGKDINRYVLNQGYDWVKLINAIAKAYITDIQTDIAIEVDNVAAKLPVTSTEFINTGALSASTKDAFDTIIANVSAANDGAEVVIMGTWLALKKINALVNGDLFANGQKDNNMNTGIIGVYDGVKMSVIPNRFKDRTYTAKTFSDKTILILPAVGEEGKFVKMVDVGDTMILEKNTSERGDYVSDIQTHEVQREYGIGTVVGRQIGKWTLP